MNICDGVKWSIEPITDCSWEAVHAMLPRVSEQRRAQALQYKHAFGQYACLKAYLMLQDLLREHYSIEGDLLFTYNEYRKPMLSRRGSQSDMNDVASRPYFSISHCKKAIAVAVDTMPIGIDIETIRHPSKSLIEKSMNTQEQQQIATSENPDKEFTALWTRKEAVLKCYGTGIIDDLHEVLSNLENLQIHTFRSTADTICTICTHQKNKTKYAKDSRMNHS